MTKQQTKTKKILLIQYAFPPIRSAESPVSARTAKYLAGQGNFIHVVSGSPAFSLDGKDNSLCSYLNHKNIKVTKIPTLESKYVYGLFQLIFPSMLFLPDFKLIWRFLATIYAYCLMKKERFDILYTRSHYLSSHMVGLFLKKKFPRISWFVHFSDPWTSNVYVKYPTERVKGINQSWEKETIRLSEYVTFSSPFTLAEMEGKYKGKKHKFGLLMHSIDPKLLVKTNSSAKKDKVVFSHLGNFYGKRSCKPLLEAMDIIRERADDRLKKIELNFIGGFSMEEKKVVNQYINEHGDERIKLVGNVDYVTSLKLMNEADALIVVDAPAAVSPFLPSKLVDYLSTKKPILGVTPANGMSAELIKEAGGKVSDYKPEGVAKCLIEMAKEIETGRAKPHNLSDKFDTRNVHADLIKKINSV